MNIGGKKGSVDTALTPIDKKPSGITPNKISENGSARKGNQSPKSNLSSNIKTAKKPSRPLLPNEEVTEHVVKEYIDDNGEIVKKRKRIIKKTTIEKR